MSDIQKPSLHNTQKRLATLSQDDAFREFQSSENGLTSADAQARRAQYGWNEITEKKTNPLLKFLSFFWGPIPWMIETACVLSAVLRHWEDLGIITVLLLLNAVVGFWEEYHAADAVASLKKTLALKCRVKRDGSWTTLESRELVPGDVIRLRLGDIVPADAKLLAGDGLELDQSMLTGESLPVTHAGNDLVFSGSIVRRGENDALVVATGLRTNFGHTVQLVSDAVGTSHFQKEMLRIGDFLIAFAGMLACLLVIVGLFRREPLLEDVQYALILAVAAIPAAMPAVLTTTMALGARFLAAKNAIVTRLESIHELAGMDILCCDKTGTLTQNKLQVESVTAFDSIDEANVLTFAALASRKEDDDPIDNAIIRRAELRDGTTSYSVTHFTPFDPVHKRTEAAVTGGDGPCSVSKGSVPVILALCKPDDALKAKTDAVEEELASRGFRALGVAKTDASGAWHFLGIIALSDPPREDAANVIQEALDMGVHVKMITGDQLPIARETARRLKLGGDILDASVFENTSHYKIGQLDADIEKADGFAKAFPDHKFYIVESLQKHNHVVGMTGDGVNDAPALHKADAGIAVSGATDAARSAADIVLLQPGLNVIIEAIKESRRIFKRMTSYAIYRIAETTRLLLFITLSVLVFHFYPITAVMVILLALLNDGAILSIAFDRANVGTAPQRWNMHVILTVSSALGTIGVASSFLLFYLCERVFDLPQDVIQSLMYLKLSVAGHLMIFHARTRYSMFDNRPAWILLAATITTQILATIIVVYGVFVTPIGWTLAGLVWVYALAWIPANEIVKRAAYRLAGA
ncbi:MAG TPA: plasma-membrane proton-efflux P-type ATPase [Candidatus Peribacteraceae bacterium]|nr:plasma-membrane proton-efflux P-type ATPase [Candidatus Peribacteraceae bacterium]